MTLHTTDTEEQFWDQSFVDLFRQVHQDIKALNQSIHVRISGEGLLPLRPRDLLDKPRNHFFTPFSAMLALGSMIMTLSS